MKVPPLPASPAVGGPTLETTREGAAAPAAPAAPASQETPEGVLLRGAQAQLAQLDGIDAARVAEIRAALERGEITFDAAKLARLIERHHGGRG